MINSGGNIYICEKKLRRGKYLLTLLDNQEIKSSGADLEQCKIDICGQIILWNGDGEAVLELTPEKSKRVATGIDMYRALGYNEGVDILNTTSPFSGGSCSKCSHEIGGRTEELLNLKSKPKNVISCIDCRTKKDENDSSRMFTEIIVYHKKFIDLLTEEEQKYFDKRIVLLQGEESDYIELIPKKVIESCGHKGARYSTITNWICNTCKRTQMSVYVKDLYPSKYIFMDPTTIPQNNTIFFLKNSLHISLVVSNDRWAELFKYKNEIKGIATKPVVVLEEKYVEYPKLEEPEKFEW